MPDFVSQPASLVNTTTAGDQLPPLTGTLSSGGVVVAWMSSADQNIYAQQYDAGGAGVGGETLVHDGAAAVSPGSVAGLADGSFVVLWTEVAGFTSSVFSQRLDASGHMLGAAALIASTDDPGAHLHADSAEALPGGGYLVTWHRAYQPTPLESGEIFAQRFDAAGAAVGGTVSEGGYMGTTTPATTVLPDGGWVTAWNDFASPMTGSRVVATQFSGAGSLVRTTTIDPNPAASEFLPSDATLASGNCVLVWVADAVLQAQLFDPAGVALGPAFTLDSPAGGAFDRFPQVTALADGGFLVSWQHATLDAGSQVLARAFDAAGQPAGATLVLDASLAGGTVPAPAQWSVTATPDGGFVVGTIEQGAASGWDVYERKYTPAQHQLGALVAGGDGQDNLVGTAGADTLDGGNGKDLLTGLAGDDLLLGGDGVDMAWYSGARSDYTIGPTAQGYAVSGPEGSDTLVDVERLHFSDASVAIDEHGSGGQAYRLYQAAFDRVPDPAGLGFWIASMDASGLDLAAVARFFVDSPEFAAKYGPLDTTGFVDQLYANVLHRAPDAGGRAYWVGHLDHADLSRAETLMYFSESAENQAALVGVIQQGMVYTG